MIPAGSPSLYSYEQKEKSACRFQLLIRANLHSSSHFFTSQKTHVLRKQCICMSAFRDKAYICYREMFFLFLIYSTDVQCMGGCNSVQCFIDYSRTGFVASFASSTDMVWSEIWLKHYIVFLQNFMAQIKSKARSTRWKQQRWDEKKMKRIRAMYQVITIF